MDKNYNPETKFNIYKIDLDSINDLTKEDGSIDDSPNGKRDSLLHEIYNSISQRKNIIGLHM